MMAKDKGQVRRVLQILAPEDQETLAILHDPPRMEELLRRHETLAQVDAGSPLAGSDPALSPLPGLRVFPAALDELTELPPTVQAALLHEHLPALLAAPQEGLALTQLFQGLWVTIYTVAGVDYRMVYQIDGQEVGGVTMLMVGTWESLEQRLAEG
jgi:hypothetical protein